MNATRWVSLSEFVKFLGRTGIAKVEGSELGWFVSWIDNSSTARARQDAIKKMDRAKMDDEQRSRRELDQQIRRAQEQCAAPQAPAPTPLPSNDASKSLHQANSSGPVKLSLSLSKPVSTPTTAPHTPAPTESAPAAPSVFSKRVNPLKAASKENVASSASAPAHNKRPPPTHMGAAERIKMEEQSRKRTTGPTMQPGIKRTRF